jgi:D-alanyl-D-alanine carboxypeptidase
MFSSKIAAVSVTAGLIVAGLVPAVGQATTPDTVAHTTLQRALDGAVNARVPGAVLLAREGNRTVRVASGYADVKRGTRMRTTDRFRVGNITTTFVATATLQLVEEGKLALDDTVESRLPGVIPNGQAITVRELLNMRSGLFDHLTDGDTTVVERLATDPTYRWSPLELIAISNRHEPRFAPDARWSYCNTCYVLLGEIIERTTGHALGDELRRRIFVPAGLRATSFDTEPRMAGRHAHGYELLGEPATLADVSVVSPSYIGAGGAIVSTADDVARFYSKLFRGHLLRPDLLDAMQTTGPMAPELEGWGYGLGLIERPMGCATAFGHDGASPGFIVYAYASRGGDRQSVLLINAGDETMAHEDNGALQHVLESAYCTGTSGG